MHLTDTELGRRANITQKSKHVTGYGDRIEVDKKEETLTGIWLEGIKLGEKYIDLAAIEDVKGGRNGLYAGITLLESSGEEPSCVYGLNGNPGQYMGLFQSIVAERNNEK